MTTKMYLVEQRGDWKPGDCYVCKFTCKGIGGINPDCPMKKAKEAVAFCEVGPQGATIQGRKDGKAVGEEGLE